MLSRSPEAPVMDPRSDRHAASHRRVTVPGAIAHGAWSALRWSLLLACLALLLGLVVVPQVMGATPYVVLTGSMRPAMPPGTIAVVEPRDFARIQIDDVVTFQARSGDPEVITHRVIGFANVGGERRLVTRGDANGTSDEAPIREEQVRGVVAYAVPWLGWAVIWIIPHRQAVIIGVSAALAVYAIAQVTVILIRRRTSSISKKKAEEIT